MHSLKQLGFTGLNVDLSEVVGDSEDGVESSLEEKEKTNSGTSGCCSVDETVDDSCSRTLSALSGRTRVG